MKIEHDTCQAVLAKAMADNESVIDYVKIMQEVMKERGHEELFFMIVALVEGLIEWDDDREDELALQEGLKMRSTILATGLLAYSATLAAREVEQLNELFADG